MSTYQYVVTAHKPTNVTHSLTAHFTGADEYNLIVAKCTRIEIFLVTPEGLNPIFDVGIYGRITSMRKYRPKVRLVSRSLKWHSDDCSSSCRARARICFSW
jgi:DNA damage-binding protein 1